MESIDGEFPRIAKFFFSFAAAEPTQERIPISRPCPSNSLSLSFLPFFSLSLSLLAPSPRITAYLLRRGRIPPPIMSLVPVDTTLQVPPPDPVQKPPEVAITPCDPWPAPYYFEGGLRRVKPYHYTYNTFCKERWRGRELVDIFLSEFRDRPAEYYVRSHLLAIL